MSNENKNITPQDDCVVADKFQWSDLYKKEDWWAIWLGFIIIFAGIISVTTEAFTFKAVKFSTWGNGTSILSVMTGEYFMQLAFSFVVLLVLFCVGAYFMGHDVKKFAIAFAGLFALAWVAYVLSAQATMKNYLEYAFWALAVGLLVSNTIGTPEWLKPALISEYYVKTGLVVMGAEVLFANITNFGIYGLAIAWFVTPVVIIFMWLFGTKFLKMVSKPMVIVIATATSVCGVSAAIAAAAAAGAKRNDLTFAIGLSLMFTVLMMVFMPIGIKAVGMDPLVGGAWIGGTVDTTSGVGAASAIYSDEANKIAMIVKATQNVLIGVVAFFIALYLSSKSAGDGKLHRPSLKIVWEKFP